MEILKKTIGHVFNEVCERYPNNDALIHTEIGPRYNYGLLSWEINRTAKGLMKLDIEKGDRVALWAPNIPEWIVAQIALAKIGAVLVPINPEIKADELGYILEQSDARAVILARGLEDTEYVDVIRELRDDMPFLEHVIVVATQSFPDTTPWTELAATGEDLEEDELGKRERDVRPENPVAIMYTSGTTGRPKGVVLDHIGVINKSLVSARRQGLSEADRLCLFIPLYHMFGNTCVALTAILAGASLVMPCLSFDPAKILRAIYRERCTAIYGSPSMLIALLDHPEFNKKKWASVKKGILGGAPCPMELMKRLVRDLGVSDITVGYGITETCSWITMTHPRDALEKRVATIGTPLECNQVKIVCPRTGKDLPPRTQGEICVKGLLMKEYYKMPAATTSAVDRRGWFHSGDLGEMDEEGYITITGRLKDVIVRDGVEITPTEVEEVIYQLPEVSEVQVFGFPHSKRGQEVAAWVKLREGSRLSLEDLSRYVGRKIDSSKVPAFYKIVSGFPMTSSGKVQKFKLAEMAQEEYL
ncbi:MAG: AMP-binding protein [Deltaproteobacteria bacterium]|nr:AMP-binding protein [Deltaproteobacteria bacterium]MBW2137345.1 AMP-binding protein [Deltaproteobacteria bacterium]